MKLKYIFCTSIIFVTVLTGCKKFVEVDTPKNQLITSSVFNRNETAIASMLNIYQSMMTSEPSTYQISLYAGLYADEFKNYSSSVNTQTMYINALSAIDAPSNIIWKQAYNYIYQANAILEGSSNSTNLDAAVKKQLIGEALFVRSFWNFYLVNLFGSIPLITTTDYTQNQLTKRIEKSVIYNQIIDDLKKAEENLGNTYLDAKDATTLERLRPNKYVASALLARVYLFTNDYSKALEQTNAIISNTSLYELVTLNTVFLKNSKEAIWQLAMPVPNYQAINTSEGRGFILQGIPATSGVQSISALSTQLLSAFEPNDDRMTNWVRRFSSAGVDYNFPYKYTVGTGTNITEYSMVFRLAEQYLIRAEAKAQLDDVGGGIEDIDKIRERAGLPLIKNINPGINKTDLLTVILKERRIELFSEWGHRWLDLKRTGTVDNVMSIVTPIKGGNWNTNKKLWPLPLTDLQNNPNLIQNEGYN